MFINGYLNKVLTKILSLVIVMLFFTNANILTVYSDDEQDIYNVKIGYSPNFGIIKDNPTYGDEGFGYEYLNKIIQYTDNNYTLEFVECDWSDGMEMLLEGELDLLAPANYSDERAENYIFSSNVFATDTAFISCIDDFNLAGYDALNGSNIAVQEDYTVVDMLEDFLFNNRIDANIITTNIDTYTTRDDDLEYDYLLASSLILEGQLNVVAKLGTTPTYLMGNVNSADIIEDFDNAMLRIEQDEYLYKERLYLKYFDYTIDGSNFISQYEYDILHQQQVYQVGYSPNATPLTYYNSKGELSGVAVDVLDMIAYSSGISFNFVDITNIDNFEFIDISLLGTDFGNGNFTDNQSIPYLNYPFLLVERESNNNNIGVMRTYEFANESLTDYLGNGSLIAYTSYEALETAFRKGEIDKVLLTSLFYKQHKSIFSDEDFTVTPLNEKLDVMFYYNNTLSKEKINVFDKFIGKLDTDLVDHSISEHTTLTQDSKITDVIRDNPIIASTFAGFFGFMILVYALVVFNQKCKLSYSLNYDSVTGLFSQHKFIASTQKLIKSSNGQYTILSIDIDNFKYINEIYGYEVGTAVLRELGHFIKKYMPNKLPVSRGNSDEFLVLLGSGDIENKINNGLHFTTEVSKVLKEVINDDYTFSFSLGYYNITDNSVDPTFMIDCANIAKNTGKKIIGTTVNEYTQEMNSERIAINEVVATMNKGLENREFVVHYQPKFDLHTMELIGAEALVRWHKNIKVVSPDHFIPIFEKNWFIEKLDYYIIENVCDFIRKNQDVDLPLISLNLSGITIMRENLVDKIMDTMERYGVNSSQLELEITESAFIDNFDLGLDKLIKLRDLGFKISMDDFGAGISSLNRLKEMPIDVLKIDREFIVDSLENEKGNKIIKNIINMAKDLELETIAEGIETIEQLDFLKDLGCDLGQGYYYSKPLPPYDFIKKVNEELRKSNN